MRKTVVAGAGFVGGTFYQTLHKLKYWELFAHDLNPENSYLAKQINDIKWAKSLDEVKDASLVVVCLPTPMIKETGECYTGIVEDFIAQVREINKDVWICIKSTIPPGTTQRLHEKFGNVCFNAEFLTEKNALQDFITLPYQIIGYAKVMELLDSLDCPLHEMYEDAYKECLIDGGDEVFSIWSTTAEMVKYTRNCYLATRLSFFNEIKQICDKLDMDFDQMKWFAGLDDRIGQHYNIINDTTFGGHCLPKDLCETIFLQNKLGIKSEVLRGVWSKNLETNKIRDWERMENRAVISKK